MEEQQESFLSEIEFTPVQASMGKRFLNYLIDVIVFYVLVIALGIIMAIIWPDFLSYNNSTDIGTSILMRIVYMALFGLYMSAMEAIFKGRSVGKFITGTKAVYEDGSNISLETAFQRGMSRVVPFEPFSAFGEPPYPWHDKWTNTYVIDLKASHVN